MGDILNTITKENDIKLVKSSDYKKLAKEIRSFLIKSISTTGGHLASNLGTVELTMALHLFLDLPKDKLVWDVGHQAYTHKVLTGRKENFTSLRMHEGLSGFPKYKESKCDAFDTGHSSTSISAAMGMVKARDLNKENHKIVAVIGDGSLSGGLALEALNNAGRMDTNFIIILNDNEMSISENVGGMANYLGKLRTNTAYKKIKRSIENTINKVPEFGATITSNLKRSKDSIKRLMIEGMLFEDMGLTYIGPIDGHNMEEMAMALESASNMNKAVLLHVITKKGKGYTFAEENPANFHGVDPFDIKTGLPKVKKEGKTYTDIFSKAMVELGEKHEDIVAICAAMPQGTGLSAFKNRFAERFVDVGIAEEHAVTFAAGLAAAGKKPVVAIYSTFLQRAYDQIIHDVCINKRGVIFAIDRAGIVGNDGETHQGIFDISYLSHMPNMTLMAPKNGRELQQMLEFAYHHQGPIAIRYPRGIARETLPTKQELISYGKSELIFDVMPRLKEEAIINKERIIDKVKGNYKKIALLAVGNMMEVAIQVYEELVKDFHLVKLINVRFIVPMDTQVLDTLIKDGYQLITLEENIYSGGYGDLVDSYIMKNYKDKISHISISLENQFIEQGDISILREKIGLNKEGIYNKIMKELN